MLLNFGNTRISQRLRECYRLKNVDHGLDVRVMVKELLEGTMVLELDDHLAEMKRQGARTSRNGFRSRSLLTSCGLLDDLRVPRDRRSTYRPKVFERYQRVEQSLNDAIVEMYIQGVSTRKVGDVLAALMGERVSAGYVSKVTKRLDQVVKQFHRRPIETAFRYLYLDGVYVRIADASGRSRRSVVFVAYGVGRNGRREMIDFRIGKSESAGAWECFIDDLRLRGLRTDRLELVITDGGKGLISAVEHVLPFTEHQLCWFHKLCNVAKRLPRRLQGACIADARKIYRAGSIGKGRKTFAWWKTKWSSTAPEAVKCLEQDLDRLLPFLTCPREHHQRIRTTNVIERSFRELRRRLRVMGSFTDRASAERILCSLMTCLNTRWQQTQNHAKWLNIQNQKAA